MEIVRDDTIIKRWNDQDVMNIACAGKVAFLPLNYIAYPYLRDNLARGPFDSPYTRDELYDSIIRPKIMHFAAQKPWSARTNWDTAWWDIADYLRIDVTRAVPVSPDDDAVQALKQAKRRWRRIALLLFALLAVLSVGLVLSVLR